MIMEVIMTNSNAILSQVMECVWCGIAFLRSSGERKFQPEREIDVFLDVLLGQEERRRFDSSTPHQTLKLDGNSQRIAN